MRRRPPRLKRTAPSSPYTSLFRSGRGLVAGSQRLLLGRGLAQLALQLADIGFALVKHGLQLLQLLLQQGRRLGELGLLHEGALGQILPALRERELGLLLPALLGLAEAGEATRGLLPLGDRLGRGRSEEHTSELQSLMRTPYAVLCLQNKT